MHELKAGQLVAGGVQGLVTKLPCHLTWRISGRKTVIQELMSLSSPKFLKLKWAMCAILNDLYMYCPSNIYFIFSAVKVCCLRGSCSCVRASDHQLHLQHNPLSKFSGNVPQNDKMRSGGTFSYQIIKLRCRLNAVCVGLLCNVIMVKWMCCREPELLKFN